VPGARRDLFVLLAFFLAACGARNPGALPSDRRPGPAGEGVTHLPNGWALSPHGRHLEVGEFPMSIAVDPQERFAAVVLSGAREQGVVLVDLERWTLADRAKVKRAWLGGAFFADGTRFALSGGGDNVLRLFRVDRAEGLLATEGEIALAGAKEEGFAGGLDVLERDGRALAYTVLLAAGRLLEVALEEGKVLRSVDVGRLPYTCLVSRDGTRLFVSLWADAKVLVLERAALAPLGTVEVGAHPNGMVEAPDGRLFVACANDDTVAVVDPRALRVLERVKTSLTPGSPEGTTPNALASLAGEKPLLAVANADNNDLALLDVGEPGETEIEGFVPTGWYPTAVAPLARSRRFLVASGKGLGSSPNPSGLTSPLRKPGDPDLWVGSLMRGTLSVFPRPRESELRALTRRTLANTPYRDERLRVAHRERGSPIPARPGDPTPIRHVLYVIKENRTYDQLFGGIERGEGDPRLVLFGPDVAPNHHAIARRWVLLDNAYADAEVSADGHQWSMGAYATDYTEKSWPTSYGPGGLRYEFEGSLHPLVAPRAGYLWDQAARAGVSYRSYGEFVTEPGPDGRVRGSVKALEGRVCPGFRGWDLDVPDQKRADAYLEELAEFEKTGEMPRLQIVRLPNDHTAGTKKGSPTPRAMVADNDLALGRILEAVSRSRFWRETAVFVLEDDAQNGPDHVDAHRMVCLLASPWAKRAFTDSTLYATSAVLRTIELVLGLAPMSQYDAGATPMWNAFTGEPDFSPYEALVPSVSREEKNVAGAFGQERIERMNLAVEDAVPELEWNEILWKAVRGEDSPMPAPVRAPWAAWAEFLGGIDR
jgi:hypothetical protein